MTNKDPDTMTPQELDEAWACAIGWRLQPEWGADKEPAWVDAEGRWKCWPAHLPSPSTNWSHWGLVYEFMVGKGWKFAAWPSMEDEDSITACWTRPLHMSYAAYDPDIRPAMVKSALKALRGEGKGE